MIRILPHKHQIRAWLRLRLRGAAIARTPLMDNAVFGKPRYLWSYGRLVVNLSDCPTLRAEWLEDGPISTRAAVDRVLRSYIAGIERLEALMTGSMDDL